MPYLLLNAGQNERAIDGGSALHRRWSTAILKDLLCRDLPVLRKEDAVRLIRPQSAISFRKKEGCMSCHGTIDPMAAVLRNMENYNSGNVDFHYTTRNIYFHSTTGFHKGDLPDRDLNFSKTHPDGRLRMRDYRGQWINKKVSGIEQLGEELAKVEDFYACTTKRYIQFFTGKNFGLEDYRELEESERLEFDELVKKLKKHKNLKILIRDILFSKFYIGDLDG